jgi:hypothetical protein
MIFRDEENLNAFKEKKSQRNKNQKMLNLLVATLAESNASDTLRKHIHNHTNHRTYAKSLSMARCSGSHL